MENPEITAEKALPRPKKLEKLEKVGDKAKTVKVLDATQSLQVEIVSLQTQLLKEQELSMNLQQAIVDLRKELHQFRNSMSAQANDKLITDLGLKGDVKLTKLPDGRYQAEF